MGLVKLWLYSWLIMLFVGNEHRHDHHVPAIGFGLTLLLVASVALAADVFRHSSDK